MPRYLRHDGLYDTGEYESFTASIDARLAGLPPAPGYIPLSPEAVDFLYGLQLQQPAHTSESPGPIVTDEMMAALEQWRDGR